QAEDGIRDFHVTGVQTCALPICGNPDIVEPAGPIDPEVGVMGVWNEHKKCIGCIVNFARHANTASGITAGWPYFMEQVIRGAMRSEERRVGKEGRSRCAEAREDE